MANLTSLPREIINYILIQENIDMEDIVNLGLTCKQLYTPISNDYFWRCKLFQRWPSLKRIHTDRLNNEINIKEGIEEGMKCEKELLRCLSVLPCIYNANDTNQTFRKNITRLGFAFPTAEDTSPLKYYYCHDKLIKLMEADPLGKRINLTNMYYAKKFIVQMKQIDLSYKWSKLKCLSDRYHDLEQVATLVAQWCQPYKLVLHSDVAASLDIIVQQILKVLKNIHPTHSIFVTPAAQFTFWKKKNIKDNHWNAKESRQIIDIIGRVIFRELNFNICCVNSHETCVDPEMFFIDQVLENKRGNLVLLEIIIKGVAKRLGVRCDLLSSEAHVFLCWKESYKNGTDRFYIDLFSDGSLVSKEDFRYRPYHVDPLMCLMKYSNCSCEIDTDIPYMKCITPLGLVQCLTINLASFSGYTDKGVIQSCWLSELVNMIRRLNQIGELCNKSSNFARSSTSRLRLCLENPTDNKPEVSDYWPNTREDPFRLGSIMCTDYENISKKCDKLTDFFSTMSMDCKEKIQSCLTRRHLKYTIGMLVEIQSPFKSAGVIIGWESKCSNCRYVSWPKLHNVSEPTMCTQNYTILACDDRELNVSQEFLKPLKMQKWINNSEIGQYFSHFEGTHYVPNQKLQMLYPIDVNILERKYSNS